MIFILKTHHAFDNVKHGDKKVVYIFLSIAVFILLIACINFMNLSTIRAVERSKEVGLAQSNGRLAQSPCLAIHWRIRFIDLYFLYTFRWFITIADAVI